MVCLGDNHYQLVMRQYLVKISLAMINQYFSNLSLIKVSFEILSLELIIILCTNLDVFPRNLVPAL